MKRMQYMVNYGYLKVIDLLPTGEYVYCITKKSCLLLGLDYKVVTQTDKLNHQLACSDYYFFIKEKKPQTFNLEVQYWFSYENKQLSFRPDVLMQIDRWYFVEIDLSNKRFESKIKTWECFLLSGEFKKYFEKHPPIIIVSTNVEKVKEIVQRNKKVNLNYVFKNYDDVKGWVFKYGYNNV